MRRKTGYVLLIPLAMIILTVAGCVTSRVPVVVSQQASFTKNLPDVIEVFPVLDDRRRVQAKMDFDKNTKGLAQQIKRSLTKKGYECLDATDGMGGGGLMANQVPFADAAQIREMGSDQTRWVLVPVVHDSFDVGLGFSSSDVTLYLFDKQAGKLAWEGHCIGLKGLSRALNNVLDKFPKTKKRT